jgi:hypothetical protein
LYLGAIDERTTGRVETTKVETRIVFETLYIYIKKKKSKQSTQNTRRNNEYASSSFLALVLFIFIRKISFNCYTYIAFYKKEVVLHWYLHDNSVVSMLASNSSLEYHNHSKILVVNHILYYIRHNEETTCHRPPSIHCHPKCCSNHWMV